MPETPGNPRAPKKIDINEIMYPELNDAYQLREFTDVLKNEGKAALGKALTKLTTERKKSIVEIATSIVRQEIRSWEDGIQWHASAALLSIAEPELYKQYQDKFGEITSKTLALIEQKDVLTKKRIVSLPPSDKANDEKSMNDPFTLLNERLVKLYQLIAVQPNAEGKRLCTDKFNEWQRQLSEKNAADIPLFLQSQIDIAQQKEKDWLRPIMKTAMSSVMTDFAEQNEYPKFRASFVERDGEYYFTSHHDNKEKRTWKVEMYSEGAPLLYFRSTNPAEPGLVFAIDMMDGFDSIEQNPVIIDTKAKEAVETYARESGNRQEQVLNTYDLPRDRPLAHVRLFPQTYDSIVSKGLESSMLLSTVLQKRGGLFIPRGPIFSDTPESALRSEIQEVLQANDGKPVHFCVDVFSHGSPNNFIFENPLEAKHILKIAKEFPECTFTCNTIACFGAGVMKDLENNPDFAQDTDLRSRVAFFTQTKGDIPNVPAYATAVTLYYIYLTQALHEGKSYGEAHRIADTEVKKTLPVDAEAMIDGKKLVISVWPKAESMPS